MKLNKNIIYFFVFLISISTLNSQDYIVEPVIHSLNQAIAFDIMPNGNVIVTEKEGLVKIHNSSGAFLSTFWNFRDSSFIGGEMGTLGICLDPNFSSNHYVYIFNVKGDAINYYFRIIRFTEVNNMGTNPLIIFSHHNPPGSNNSHAAGNMHFDNDGTLYFGIGTAEAHCFAQSLNCPRGKILRINTNGTAPSNNPFYDDGNPLTGNDDRIWAYGLRNPYEFCISPVNDSIYCGDNSNGPDEINFIRKGKNYGYPACTGICGNPLYADPILQLPGSTVPTGMLVYNGSAFPSLNGKLLFASYGTRKIYKCDLGNAPFYDTILSYTEWVTTPTSAIPNIMKQGPDGFIYLTMLNYSVLGRIRPPLIGINNSSIISNFNLMQNYPNPFNPTTSIKYEIPKQSFVTLKVYDVLGIEITSLVNETKQQGSHEISWHASSFPSGVYFYELQTGEYKERRKMVLLK